LLEATTTERDELRRELAATSHAHATLLNDAAVAANQAAAESELLQRNNSNALIRERHTATEATARADALSGEVLYHSKSMFFFVFFC
jgi:hypothetical protein